VHLAEGKEQFTLTRGNPHEVSGKINGTNEEIKTIECMRGECASNEARVTRFVGATSVANSGGRFLAVTGRSYG
jgi:hypothetical protein